MKVRGVDALLWLENDSKGHVVTCVVPHVKKLATRE